MLRPFSDLGALEVSARVDWTELHTRTLQQVWETDLVGSSEIAATRIIPAMRRVDHEIVAACVGVDPAVRVLDPLCRTHDVDD